MAEASDTLLFEGSEAGEFEPQHATGLLPAQYLRTLIEHSREIRAAEPIEPDQLQPASLDLRLGGRVYRVRASFLPGATATVQDKIDTLAMHDFALDAAGAVLEKGCVYIAAVGAPARASGLGDRQPQELDRPDRRVHPPDHRPERRIRPGAPTIKGRSTPRSRRARSASWFARATG